MPANYIITASNNVVEITASLGQSSLLTLATIGADGDVFTATLVDALATTTIQYTVDISTETTLALQATEFARLIDINASTSSIYAATATGVVITITNPIVFTTAFNSFGSGGTTGTFATRTIGNQTNTLASVTSGTGTAAIAAATPTDGIDSRDVKDTFAIDFKGASAPASISFVFTGSGLTTLQAAQEILSTVNPQTTGGAGVTMDIVADATTFPAAPNQVTLVEGSQRIRYTYNSAGDETNTATGAATVSMGDTGGTFAAGSVATVTEGVTGSVTGTLDTWSVTINGTEYTGTFTTQSDANSQATQIADALNAV